MGSASRTAVTVTYRKFLMACCSASVLALALAATAAADIPFTDGPGSARQLATVTTYLTHPGANLHLAAGFSWKPVLRGDGKRTEGPIEPQRRPDRAVLRA